MDVSSSGTNMKRRSLIVVAIVQVHTLLSQEP
jgi:hypothetical protein